MRTDATLAILTMALVTYCTRAGGLWLMRRLPPSRRLAAALRHMPGALLVAIVVPIALAGGAASLVAVAGAALVAVRSGRVMPAIVAGVALVALLRAVLH